MKVITDKRAKIIMVKMNKHEALATIRSLTNQMISGNPNAERVEMTDEEGRYVSIAVVGGE